MTFDIIVVKHFIAQQTVCRAAFTFPVIVTKSMQSSKWQTQL